LSSRRDDYSYAFCDGGKRKCAVVYRWHGADKSCVSFLNENAKNDDTESLAVLRACEFAEKAGGNWIIVTDSRAVIKKIEGGTNATRQPNINGIKNILKRVNEKRTPCSIHVRWARRLSEPEMVEADRLCREKKNEG